jgi:Zn-dependent protease
MSIDDSPKHDSADSAESADSALGDDLHSDSPPVDERSAAVLTQLERDPTERTWVQTAMLLGVSLLVFAMTGFFNNDPTRLALLIGVLLFHELGHFAGMRLFNYQDVRMFFIPFFGAAVAGRPRSVEGYKEAIVILLGPLPGILLGAVVGVFGVAYDSEILHSAAMLLLIVNGFNLLPFLPLDGGRLLHLVLFCRQPWLEAIFRTITGGLLALCGRALGAWLLVVLGIWIVLATGYTFRVSQIAQKLRGPLPMGGKMDLSARIPREQAMPLIELVRERFPQMTQAQALANTVRQVWDRIHLRPPGLFASLCLLALYGGGFIAAPIALIGLSVATQRGDAPLQVEQVEAEAANPH